MILGFLFFIQTFLRECKALRTEKYKRYINIFIIIIIIYLLLLLSGLSCLMYYPLDKLLSNA